MKIYINRDSEHRGGGATLGSTRCRRLGPFPHSESGESLSEHRLPRAMPEASARQSKRPRRRGFVCLKFERGIWNDLRRSD